MANPLLRRPNVQAVTGLSRSTLYLRISQGLWTKPVAIGSRSVAWPESEVITLNAARIAGKSNDEIRELVQQLEKDRIKAFKGVGDEKAVQN